MEPQHQNARRRVARLGPAESLCAPLVRYLFGPKPTLVIDPEALLTEIDRLGGVVVPADIMRVTGLRRAASETLLCRLAARHGGDIFVHEAAVLYRFPKLRPHLPRLMFARQTPGPIWEQRRLPDPITGNRPVLDRLFVLTNLLILIAAAATAAWKLSASSWQSAFAILVILVFSAALSALAMPLTRLARRRAHATEVAAENGRRALVRAVLQRRCGTMLGAHALSHAWVAGSGGVIPRGRLDDEVRALGGEPDIDCQARLYFRFPDLDHEVRALTRLRSPTSPSSS
jgi:hypothetical protein